MFGTDSSKELMAEIYHVVAGIGTTIIEQKPGNLAACDHACACWGASCTCMLPLNQPQVLSLQNIGKKRGSIQAYGVPDDPAADMAASEGALR